jgi:alkylation response protein AidB-like acyl-CoA dehydrogenase
MAAGINWYKADLREMFFVLLEQFGYGQIAGKPPFEPWGPEEAKATLSEAYRLAREVLGPLNSSGDREGCRVEAGHVITPKGFKDAWKQVYESGFKSLAVETEHGGQGAPAMVAVLVEELLTGSNTAFSMYTGLALGAAEMLIACATPDQVKRYTEKMLSGAWGGTMCLTEPHAGSDVGAAKTTAKKQPDGTYKIRGTKIFISGGDHDLAENIIHMVLARVEGAPIGTKGLSLFIVPTKRIDKSGASGANNDVHVASIEHKMGINGSATCVLNFGDNDGCVGELVGTTENVGMSQMFKMMNTARIGVGIQGLAVMSTAYLNALAYAKERKQGSNYKHWKDAASPRVNIIEHPDVRRMLLEMKAKVEGVRALVMKLASHQDRAIQLSGKDDEKAAYHRGQVELLTPLVKAYATDTSFEVCAEAIQVYGGAGFLKDNPVEQYTRDAKIFSIYEGTNHIQAMDLVGRKLGMAGGAHFQQFMADVTAFVEANRAHATLGAEVQRLGAAQEAVVQAAMQILGWSQSDKVALIAVSANRFLGMMSQLAVAWLLLDAACISDKALAKLPATHEDRHFYQGKIQAALWYGRNVLPDVEHGAKKLLLEDGSPMEIQDGAFATL